MKKASGPGSRVYAARSPKGENRGLRLLVFVSAAYSDAHSVGQDQILCKFLFCFVLDAAALLAGVTHMRQMFVQDFK